MSQRSGTPLWLERGLFTGLALLAIYLPLLPFSFSGTNTAIVMPDLLFALCTAWVLRRPESVPFLLVAALAFLADVMLSRPLGLWALLLLLGTEFIRGQGEALRDRLFVIEWFTVSVVFAIMMALQLIVLFVALVPLPSIGTMLAILLATVVAYPVVVAILHVVLRVRAPRPTERSRLGRVA